MANLDGSLKVNPGNPGNELQTDDRLSCYIAFVSELEQDQEAQARQRKLPAAPLGVLAGSFDPHVNSQENVGGESPFLKLSYLNFASSGPALDRIANEWPPTCKFAAGTPFDGNPKGYGTGEPESASTVWFPLILPTPIIW